MLSTAYSPIDPALSARPFLVALIVAFAVFWLWAAYAPVYRFDWFLENILVFATTFILVAAYRWLPLSDVSYILLFVFLVLHVIGSHYTYSFVPAGFWAQEAFGLSRNHYDRLVHFSFGLLLFYPLREVVIRKVTRNTLHAGLFALSICWSLSGSFEIMEWIIASIVDPEAGIAYLGIQGDEWDAQKDTALASAGALAALLVSLLAPRRPAHSPERPSET